MKLLTLQVHKSINLCLKRYKFMSICPSHEKSMFFCKKHSRKLDAFVLLYIYLSLYKCSVFCFPFFSDCNEHVQNYPVRIEKYTILFELYWHFPFFVCWLCTLTLASERRDASSQQKIQLIYVLNDGTTFQPIHFLFPFKHVQIQNLFTFGLNQRRGGNSQHENLPRINLKVNLESLQLTARKMHTQLSAELKVPTQEEFTCKVPCTALLVSKY